MKNSYSLIGFDVRTPGLIGCDAEKSSDADKPFRPRGANGSPWITFDKYINPSVFVAEEDLARRKRADALAIPRNANVGFDLFALWDDLSDMMVYYSRGKDSGDAGYAYATIDLQEHELVLPSEDTVEVLVSRSVTPGIPSEEWPLLGYDIVSPYFISALSGYMHSQTDQALVDRIQAHVNSFGLVAASAAPHILASLTREVDEKIDEDPFFLVAIFLIWDSSREVARVLG